MRHRPPVGLGPNPVTASLGRQPRSSHRSHAGQVGGQQGLASSLKKKKKKEPEKIRGRSLQQGMRHQHVETRTVPYPRSITPLHRPQSRSRPSLTTTPFPRASLRSHPPFLPTPPGPASPSARLTLPRRVALPCLAPTPRPDPTRRRETKKKETALLTTGMPLPWSATTTPVYTVPRTRPGTEYIRVHP